MGFIYRTTRLRFMTLALTGLAGLAMACNPRANLSEQQESNHGSQLRPVFQPVGGTETLSSLADPIRLQKIRVLNTQNQPVPNATILIGPRLTVPFANNSLSTDSAGEADVPAGWIDAQPLTVEAQGHVRATWYDQAPTGPVTLRVYVVRKAIQPVKNELFGETTGYEDLSNDGFLDVGVVFPALKREQLASIQVSDLISPEADKITVVGQEISIPSNISIPLQRERYNFLIIPTLDKPIYRAFFNESRAWRVVTTHVRFPFRPLVDHLRAGKSFFDAINFFDFQSSTVRDYMIVNSRQTANLPIKEAIHEPIHPVTAPAFNARNSLLALSVIQSSNLLYPTDVKLLGPNEARTLKAPRGVPGFLVAALRDKTAQASGAIADSMSISITPNTQSANFKLYEIPAPPIVTSQRLATSPPPEQLIASVTPQLTYAILSRVSKVTSGNIVLDSKQPLWDVYSPGWKRQLDLPELPAPTRNRETVLRWEVGFAASPNGTTVPLSPEFIDSVTHLAKSATSF